MTETIDAFHAAIYANPADPLPRLMYADWLDDHGEAEYAELIRLAAEVVRRPSVHHRRGRLRRRQTELYRNVYAAWRLAELLPGRTWRVKFVNGLAPDELSVTTDELAAANDWPQFLRPRRLQVSLRVGDEAELAGCGYLGRTTHLTVSQRIEHCFFPWEAPADPLLEALATCPHLGSLDTLNVCDLTPTPGGLLRFAEAAVVGRLTRFDLSYLTGEFEPDRHGHPWPARTGIAAACPPAGVVRRALQAGVPATGTPPPG